jgi:hypothetical protein
MAWRTLSGIRSFSKSASMSATSVGATIAARQTASHSGITGRITSAVATPRVMASGMPITNSRNVTSRRRTTADMSSSAAWLNRITVNASWAKIVKLLASGPLSRTSNPKGPNTIPRSTKISAGAKYHFFTRPETTA